MTGKVGITIRDIVDLAQEMPTRRSIDWSKTKLDKEQVYSSMVFNIYTTLEGMSESEKLITLYAALTQKSVEDFVNEYSEAAVTAHNEIVETVKTETKKNDQLEPKITDFDYLTSSLGNAYFSNLSFEDLWDAVEMSEDREQLDAAIWAAIELKELHEK